MLNGDTHTMKAFRLAGAGLAALTLALVALVATSTGVRGGNGNAFGHCPSGDWTKVDAGDLPAVVNGATISQAADKKSASFSSPTANVTGFSVKGGGTTRNTVTYDPPVASGTVASTVNPGGNLSDVSNVCIRFGTGSTTTTEGPTTTTAAGPTTTVGPAGTTTTTAAVLGVVVEPEAPAQAAPAQETPAAVGDVAVLPAELARTGAHPLALALAGLGMLLVGGAIGLHAHGVAVAARRVEARI